MLADPEYTWSGAQGAQKIGNYRAALGVPLFRQDEVVGVLFIAKTVPQPFTAKQIELAMTFADQAVIAIENTRLLNELRKSLRQQTATADVLKVISRSAFDLPTVLQTLVKSAAKLCESDKTTIIRQKGNSFYITEAYGFSSEFIEAVKNLPIEPTLGTASGRVLLEGHIVHIPDVEADAEYTFTAKSLGDYRTILALPMLREGQAIGVLVLTRRTFGRSQTSRSRPRRLLPTRQRSRSRTCACSRVWRRARANWRNHWRSCGPRRTAWSRPRSSPRSVN